MCHDHAWLSCCFGFWVLGGAGQFSWEPGAESGLRLLSHLLLICPHQDTFIGAAGATSIRLIVSLSLWSLGRLKCSVIVTSFPSSYLALSPSVCFPHPASVLWFSHACIDVQGWIPFFSLFHLPACSPRRRLRNLTPQPAPFPPPWTFSENKVHVLLDSTLDSPNHLLSINTIYFYFP